MNGALQRPHVGWPLFMLLVTGVAYGLTYTLAGVSVRGGIPFFAYVFWLGVGAGVIMFVLSLLFRKPPRVTLTHLKCYLVTGASGYAVPYIIVAVVLGHGVPAGIMSMVIALAPMMTYLGAVMFRLERAWWLKYLGLVIGIAGIVLIVAPERSLPSPDLVIWILISLMVPLCYATTTIAAAIMRPPAMDSLSFSAGYFLTPLPILFVAMFAAGDFWAFGSGFGGAEWALVMSAVVQGLGIYLFLELVMLMGPVFFTTVNFITPLTGILFGMAFFDERLSYWVWIALVPLFLGLLFVILPRPGPK
ncbi:MAG: DMT family transporter [Alphaproteobacteria bacterium]|jgi:drug/metabolite transporter (DMT)-like permease|nr:DMT family transporter [Alphaproteobacteria bacterium]MDP6588939.1 DMT family transporter [Alphaproteobacteria bacterium]MDP6817156.1 DMT family transporter [Alphaproteobacteria bacterium]